MTEQEKQLFTDLLYQLIHINDALAQCLGEYRRIQEESYKRFDMLLAASEPEQTSAEKLAAEIGARPDPFIAPAKFKGQPWQQPKGAKADCSAERMELQDRVLEEVYLGLAHETGLGDRTNAPPERDIIETEDCNFVNTVRDRTGEALKVPGVAAVCKRFADEDRGITKEPPA